MPPLIAGLVGSSKVFRAEHVVGGGSGPGVGGGLDFAPAVVAEVASERGVDVKTCVLVE